MILARQALQELLRVVGHCSGRTRREHEGRKSAGRVWWGWLLLERAAGSHRHPRPIITLLLPSSNTLAPLSAVQFVPPRPFVLPNSVSHTSASHSASPFSSGKLTAKLLSCSYATYSALYPRIHLSVSVPPSEPTASHVKLRLSRGMHSRPRLSVLCTLTLSPLHSHSGRSTLSRKLSRRTQPATMSKPTSNTMRHSSASCSP